MLTKKQRDLLLFIHERLSESDIPPSFEEMKDALGLKSKSGIHRLISGLEERGYIERLPHRARALEIKRLPDGFTKQNDDKVKAFGKQLAMHIAASNPLALEASKIDEEILDKEVSLISEELKNTGKSEDIVKKISIGKINKFKEDNALLTQAWVMEPKKKVKDILKELSIADLKIKDFYRLKIGE
mgnify:CR=1 FL=1